MPVKKFKPTSPGRRHMAINQDEVSKEGPEKSLLAGAKKKRGGRNAHGRMTVRHQGGGHKQRHRIIDFRRTKDGVPAKVVRLEYDPNRSASIALLYYVDGAKAYILAPVGIGPGDVLESGPGSDIKAGNALALREIPVGTVVHNIELKPGRGGQMARSAGSSAQLMAKEGNYGHLRLPSGEVRLVHLDCRATVGQVGNVQHENQNSGKAGRKRHMGIRPTVRGVATNPVDHPHGGGEGKAPTGRNPVTPWGQKVGKKTRKRNKYSDKFIVRRRKRRK